MVSLTPDLFTMRFGVPQVLCFLGRVFGNQRFLGEWCFFLWTAAHGRILTLDNLMLRGCSLATWCCMCCCDGESVDHLLLHCPVTHSLWTFMLQAFGIHWAMPGSLVGLLSCWHQWLRKYNSDIWNLVQGCLMWIVWLERNRRSFEDNEETLDELKVLCQCSLLE